VSSFGAIPHSGLMSAIEERISDRHLLKLLRAMLRAGVLQDGAVHRDETGTPQGGVISPCLCNVYLHRLDRQWTERGTGILVRFADLSRSLDKSAYAESRVMPSSGRDRPWLLGDRV
jgi:RNA-directed DNA polymerase